MLASQHRAQRHRQLDKCISIELVFSGRLNEVSPDELWALIDVLEARAKAASEAIAQIEAHLIELDYKPPPVPAHDTH